MWHRLCALKHCPEKLIYIDPVSKVLLYPCIPCCSTGYDFYLERFRLFREVPVPVIILAYASRQALSSHLCERGRSLHALPSMPSTVLCVRAGRVQRSRVNAVISLVSVHAGIHSPAHRSIPREHVITWGVHSNLTRARRSTGLAWQGNQAACIHVAFDHLPRMVHLRVGIPQPFIARKGPISADTSNDSAASSCLEQRIWQRAWRYWKC